MNVSIKELIRAYAKLGVKYWNEYQPYDVREKARQRVDADILDTEIKATNVINYMRPGTSGKRPVLIPMPCEQSKVYSAFFTPWLGRHSGQENWSFNLVVLLQQGYLITFRFEPSVEHYPDARHGYEHVQLSQTLGPERVRQDASVSPLPNTYPAFPIPSQDKVTRFLSMVVAMHGYPAGTLDIIQKAFIGEPGRARTYLGLVKTMLKK